jgi:hypothetical protein
MKLNWQGIQQGWRTAGALAINVESAKVSVTYLRRENGGSREVKSFVVPLGAEAVIEDPERVGRELAGALASAGIRERRCVTCLPPGWALVVPADLPAVTGEDLRDYFELCAERSFPVPTAELQLAHCPYVLPDGRRKVTLVAVPAKRMDAVKRMLAVASCRPVSISLGLDECVGATEPLGKGGLHFLANGRHVDLVVTAGGGVVTVRSLPWRSPEGADARPFGGEAFRSELRLTLGRLPTGLRDQVRHARFTGPGISAEALFKETLEPLRRLGIEGLAPGEESRGTAVEAAKRHLEGESVLFEFVPPQTTRWHEWLQRIDTRRHRWIMAAAVGVVVLPVALLGIRSHQERRLQAEWARMEATVTELEIVQGNIRQFRSWYETSPRSLQIIEGLAAAFPEVGEVWAKSIEVLDGTQFACAGQAQTQLALMAFLERLRERPEFIDVKVPQVLGVDPVQFRLTGTWGGGRDE